MIVAPSFRDFLPHLSVQSTTMSERRIFDPKCQTFTISIDEKSTKSTPLQNSMTSTVLLNSTKATPVPKIQHLPDTRIAAVACTLQNFPRSNFKAQARRCLHQISSTREYNKSLFHVRTFLGAISKFHTKEGSS